MGLDQLHLGQSEDFARLQVAWERTLKRLGTEISGQWFNRFLLPLKAASLQENKVILQAPGKFVGDWVREKLTVSIETTLSDELKQRVSVEIQTGLQARVAETPGTYDYAVTRVGTPATPMGAFEAPPFEPNERYSFDSFVVGQSNRLAVAGAKAVADFPGEKYNPLFIYGVSGLGKTHLLHAIAREILNRDPSFPVTYISAQTFAEQFVNSLQSNRVDQFRKSQRNAGIWLVDDVQFIMGKDKTQEEVFHTFNALHQTRKQIVLCADRPPRDLFHTDERLRSRFEAGLVADIQMPDTETRCAILLKKADQDHIKIELDVARYLAENVPGNIRTLEGALTKLAVQASLNEKTIGMDLADEIVERYYKGTILVKPSFEQIVGAVSKHFRIAPEAIMGTSRKAPVAKARHVAVFVTREITRDSWMHIGSLFGDRDHTSMMHGYQRVQRLMQDDKDLASTVKMIIRNLYPEN